MRSFIAALLLSVLVARSRRFLDYTALLIVAALTYLRYGRASAIGAIVVAVLLSGCSDSATSRSRASADGGAPSATSMTPAPRPQAANACTAADVERLVRSFVRGFNRGDMAVLDRLFAREPDFEWYSTNGPGARLNEAAYDRTSLVRYFAARHARGERLRLRFFRFNGNVHGVGLDRYGNFQYALVRSADDLEPTRYHGKGAARCYESGDLIFVWSMGRE